MQLTFKIPLSSCSMVPRNHVMFFKNNSSSANYRSVSSVLWGLSISKIQFKEGLFSGQWTAFINWSVHRKSCIKKSCTKKIVSKIFGGFIFLLALLEKTECTMSEFQFVISYLTKILKLWIDFFKQGCLDWDTVKSTEKLQFSHKIP